jgi:hypothetical protein
MCYIFPNLVRLDQEKSGNPAKKGAIKSPLTIVTSRKRQESPGQSGGQCYKRVSRISLFDFLNIYFSRLFNIYYSRRFISSTKMI